MKKIIVSATVLAILAGFSTFVVTAQGQNDAAGSNSGPHKIGLIDMAHVFKKYKKFEILREDLKANIAQSDQKARGMAERVKSLQGQMKELKEGGDKFLKLEKQLAQSASDFEAFRKVAQRDFLRKESQIYKTIYLEVADAVHKYAKYYDYTLIIRFDREEVSKTENPAEVLKRMNRQVVHHRPEDDITLSVLDFLNRQYSSANSNNKSGSPRSQN